VTIAHRPASAALLRLVTAELDIEFGTLTSPGDLLQRYLRLAVESVPGAVDAALVAIEDGTETCVARASDAAAAHPAVISFELPPLRSVRYVLHLYAAEDDVFDEAAEALLPAIGARIRAALAFEDKASNLHLALTSRQLIGQATGVLMERHRINEAAAFDRLVHASQQGHLKLREVAQRVVETGLEPGEAVAHG
jgi:hypothetical protein